MTMTLCPGCEKPIKVPSIITDKAGRKWHGRCIERVLADYFRTPLSAIDATAAVEFEADPKARGNDYSFIFEPPHSFHCREMILPADAEITGIFIGAERVAFNFWETSIRANDLPDRKLIIDHDAPMAIPITVNTASKQPFKFIGERRPEKQRSRRDPKHYLAVAKMHHDCIAPDAIDRVDFFAPAPFLNGILVCDDWQGWEIVEVLVGNDPGRRHIENIRLAGTHTEIPTYIAQPGERTAYVLKNLEKVERPFDARVYGYVKRD